MNMDTLKDDRRNFSIPLKLYLLIACIQGIFNILLYTFLLHGTDYMDTRTNFLSSSISILIIFPLLSLLLGAVIALIPYKNIPYKRKYFPATLLIFFILNSLISILLLLVLGKLIITVVT